MRAFLESKGVIAMASFKKYKTKKGDRWMFKIYAGIDPETGHKTQTTRRGFLTRDDAKFAARRLEQEMDIGITRNNPTFEDVFFEWWPTHKATLKASTIHTKKVKYNKRVLPAFRNLKIRDITPAYCQQVINKWARVVKPKDFVIQTNLVFKYAIRRKYIAESPLDHVIIPSHKDELLANDEEKRNYWELDEVNEFLDKAEANLRRQEYIMFYMLIFIGLRKGELAALTWKDINFAEKTIKINKTLFFEDGKEVAQTLKTSRKSKEKSRVKVMDDETAKLLRRWQIEQREGFLADGIREDIKYVICRHDRRPIRLSWPNDRLESAIKKFGLHRITVHGLRHTHASLLFEAGATLKDVQDSLGHKDVQTTMDIYTHVTKTKQVQTADLLRAYTRKKPSEKIHDNIKNNH